VEAAGAIPAVDAIFLVNLNERNHHENSHAFSEPTAHSAKLQARARYAPQARHRVQTNTTRRRVDFEKSER
jgi:hypothetical protein